MDDVKDMYEVMLRTSKNMDMLYEAYKEQVADNAQLKTLIQEEKEEKQQLELKLQAMIEALEELRCNDHTLQEKDIELRKLLQEDK